MYDTIYAKIVAKFLFIFFLIILVPCKLQLLPTSQEKWKEVV